MYWPIIYYTIQVFKVMFLGALLFLMYYLNLVYSCANPIESLFSLKLFRVLSPIYLVFIVIEATLQYYVLFFKKTSKNEKSKKASLTKVGPKKMTRRQYSSLGKYAKLGRVVVDKHGKITTIPPVPFGSPVAGETFSNIMVFSRITLKLVAAKYFTVDLPDSMPLGAKIHPTWIQQTYHEYIKYGFRMETSTIHSMFDILQNHIGAEKATAVVLKHLNGSKNLTFKDINDILDLPEHEAAREQFLLLERLIANKGVGKYFYQEALVILNKGCEEGVEKVKEGVTYPFKKLGDIVMSPYNWWYSDPSPDAPSSSETPAKDKESSVGPEVSPSSATSAEKVNERMFPHKADQDIKDARSRDVKK